LIVLDASVVVELLIAGPLADIITHHLVESGDAFIVPHLLDIEVMSALRNLTAGRRIDPHRSQEFLAKLDALPADRCPHTPLLQRIWELRHNFTAYDAAYIALAEATDSTLYTCDEKLRKGHRARVRLFTASASSF
jgi:predicted nucleic acid-binding protein